MRVGRGRSRGLKGWTGNAHGKQSWLSWPLPRSLRTLRTLTPSFIVDLI